jgi:HlyD family secretion protein
VDTNVDEADIGRIRVDQRVTFTVDSFPGHEFKGSVKQIRKAPETVQNVVTYTVVVSADNPDLRLLPGMTANVQIVVNERAETLKVPNAALRFRPSGAATDQGKASGGALPSGPVGGRTQLAINPVNQLTEVLQLSQDQQAQLRAIFDEAGEQSIALRQQGATPEEIRAEIQRIREGNRGVILQTLTPEQRVKFRRLVEGRGVNQVTRGRVWVLGDDGIPTPVDIMIGISDGSFTEVVQGELQAGQQVIMGTTRPTRKSSGKNRRRFGF